MKYPDPKWRDPVAVPEPEPVQANLSLNDLALLTSVADQITGPIVLAIASVAAERDNVTAALEAMTDHLADMVLILQGIGWTPTYALDRDAWEAARAALVPSPPPPPA